MLFPLERTTDPVAVVLIDEHALAAFGQWPWPRTRVADLIKRISDQQPASIGLDMVFAEPDRFSPGNIADEIAIIPSNLAQMLRSLLSNDQQLADTIRGRKVVLGIAAGLPDPRYSAAPRAAPVVTKGDRNLQLDNFPGHLGNVPVVEPFDIDVVAANVRGARAIGRELRKHQRRFRSAATEFLQGTGREIEHPIVAAGVLPPDLSSVGEDQQPLRIG